MLADLDRFWSKVDRSAGPDECWPWLASRRGDGPYGQVRFEGANHAAHRVAWRLTHGEWPAAGAVVCHSCDNPRCCNPAHLWLGSQADNMRDMWTKGRGHDGTRVERGERRYNAKLTEQKVREIRAAAAYGASRGSLAKQYGVDPSLIRGVVLGTAWRHVR